MIETAGGAEDIVGLPMPSGAVRLFVREPAAQRIGWVDITEDRPPATTVAAWQPKSGDFQPLGLSLISGDRPGNATLYVLDKSRPARTWRLTITNGTVASSELWFATDVPTPSEDRLDDGNDIQAVDNQVYATRFSTTGFLRETRPGWPGVLRLRQPHEVAAMADGLHGSNGIVNLSATDLLVADYWGRRLRFVPKESTGSARTRPATATLSIHPDNLTRDPARDRILIAGQRFAFLAALNLLISCMPSPSAVYAIRPTDLRDTAEPTLLWEGGWTYGRSVSVAVPVPGGLALGQINAPGILIVDCDRGARDRR